VKRAASIVAQTYVTLPLYLLPVLFSLIVELITNVRQSAVRTEFHEGLPPGAPWRSSTLFDPEIFLGEPCGSFISANG
jgi:hypothetical protein